MSHGLVNETNLMPQAVSPSGSPFTYQNSFSYIIDLAVQGGTVTNIEWSKNGSTYYSMGLLSGILHLGPTERLRITYILAPTITAIPR